MTTTQNLDAEEPNLVMAETIRRAAMARLSKSDQSNASQYFTPIEVAKLLVSLVDLPANGQIRVLDPGAGTGMLSAALLERAIKSASNQHFNVTLVEKDAGLFPAIVKTMELYKTRMGPRLVYQVVLSDFIDYAIESSENDYDLIIQNPPYKKLAARSPDRIRLSLHGVDVPNYYAAFMALSVGLLKPHGQLVSITPRSFASGSYYDRFRSRFLRDMSIRSLFLFHSRTSVFSDSQVVQEALITAATRGGARRSVTVHSAVDQNEPPTTRTVDYEKIVAGGLIHIPVSDEDEDAISWDREIFTVLEKLDLEVSTGKVVDFRATQNLRSEETDRSFPMLYISNVLNEKLVHPLASGKPQWFEPVEDKDSRLLIPAGTYVLIKRFTSKEEERRLVACVCTALKPIAIDNKLNYIHAGGSGLTEDLAAGLTNWLNCRFLDSYFRVFSGHTQVNAGDLRALPFPPKESLLALGQIEPGNQKAIEQHLAKLSLSDRTF